MSRYNEGFEGRFNDDGDYRFNEWGLFNRIEEMIGKKVSIGFIWGFVEGILEVSEYEFVYGERLLNELRLYWKECRNV
jgi:hypothetical protein